ncbi:MAG TPA: UDP-N-acetylmuramate dehydrogenase [Acidimicrobiales bacterium]|nr:MAG: UDP-N-acetylenolpyruvoylglucosamine reductase [Actinobacteria bacterium 21-73-9]HQU27257.1 UDP-N-acetylmuramate dehydrogenase [Acidimicrobiales bacterium]
MSLARLARVGGARVSEHAPLGSRTTYRVGGTARVLVSLARRGDLDELGPLLGDLGLDLVAVGNGSNLLVADGEVAVCVVRLEGEFADLDWRDDGDGVLVELGAGLDLPVAARRLARAGVTGFEWAVGVPGTVGGAVAMNAGGHGSDLAASLVSATLWREGRTERRDAAALELGYRHSALVPGELVLGATLRLRRGDPAVAESEVRSVVRWRREHQPGGANAGSVFRNPPGDHAARLIEATGLKGWRRGSARVSEKHANFIQADEGGRAEDVYGLIVEVRARVLEATGVALVCENRFLGFEAPA